MDPHSDFISGEAFHTGVKRVYDGALGWAVNKAHSRMAKVVYEPSHENLAYEDPARRGQGKNFATWVFSEEPGLEEHVFESGLELMMDAALEPHASIGLHYHARTEEVYYILSGNLTMTTVGPEGQTHTQTLHPGDAHAVKLGQGHYGTAGSEGVRFLTVAVRA